MNMNKKYKDGFFAWIIAFSVSYQWSIEITALSSFNLVQCTNMCSLMLQLDYYKRASMYTAITVH